MGANLVAFNLLRPVVEPKEGPVMVDRVYPVTMMHSPAAAQWVNVEC